MDRRDLGIEVLADLRGLSKQGAEFVAGHLVAAGALADEDPQRAWEHARAARSQGGRIAVVRETVGLVAYRAEQWSEAIGELRAARRMAGGPGLLAVIADAERALGNPDRAIELSRTPEAGQLDAESAAELQIVVAGARVDLGQTEAALSALRGAVRDVDAAAPHAFRLYYAYAALLGQTGHPAEALEWFVRAADADTDEESDALERVQKLSAEQDRVDVEGAQQNPADRDVAEPDAADQEAVGQDRVDVEGTQQDGVEQDRAGQERLHAAAEETPDEVPEED